MPYPRHRGHLLAAVLLGAVDERLEDLVERGGDAGVLDAAGPELDVADLHGLGVEAGDDVARQAGARAVGDVALGGEVGVFDDAADERVAVDAGVEAWLDEPEGFRLVGVRHCVCGAGDGDGVEVEVAVEALAVVEVVIVRAWADDGGC